MLHRLWRHRPGAAVAAAATAVASGACCLVKLESGPDPVVVSAVRSAALRARSILDDPPAIFRRCAEADWRGYATPGAMAELTRSQDALRGALAAAATSWRTTNGNIDSLTVQTLTKAAELAEAACLNARRSAAAGAAAVPWGEKVHGKYFERLKGGRGADECTDDRDADGVSSQRLRGHTVALYFTASWVRAMAAAHNHTNHR